VGLIFLCLIFVTGCQLPRVEPVDPKWLAPDPSAEMDFYHGLSSRPITTNDEAFHGLLLLFTGTSAPTYDARVEKMKQLKLLDARFSAQPDQAVDRGTVAVALCRGLKVRGGLVMSLTGATPRYAVRELRTIGILPATSSPNQTLSGAEFVSVLAAAEDYQTGDPSRVPANQMPGARSQ